LPRLACPQPSQDSAVLNITTNDKEEAVKPIIMAAVASAAALSACSYTETRTVHPVPATAAVVTPAPTYTTYTTPTYTATTYTTPTTTTTVYR
jgi:hypothetical protein